VHAYAVLYTRAPVDVRIQIMKNLYSLGVLKAAYHKWFQTQMRDDSIAYVLRANCADFILRHDPNEDHKREARAFLKILEPFEEHLLYTHSENVHAFVPRVHLLEKILTDPTLARCKTQEISEFIFEHKYHEELFQQRILNDKTQLGTLRHKCTLEELLCTVWNTLTEDLKHLLMQDIESSAVLDEGWLCTTGYYHRILNVYQSMTDDSLFDDLFSLEAFQESFNQKLNNYLRVSSDQENIFVELTESSEAFRIRYLEFRIHSLPRVIEELRAEYEKLSQPVFEEWVNLALRKYESF
jgi:hypothetical protein